MFYLGVGLVVSVVVAIFVLLFTRREVKAGAILGFGAVGILAGIVLVELPSIHRVVVNLGEGKSLNFDLAEAVSAVQTKASEVETETAEVKALKQQTAKLAQEVKASEASVTQMRDGVQRAYQALFETMVFEFDTRNMFPPPIAVIAEMDRRLTALGDFAFGNAEGRAAAVQRINAIIAQAKAAPTPAATPTAK